MTNAAQKFPTTAITDGTMDLVVRAGIVRLGPQLELYTETNHASLGIVSVAAVPMSDPNTSVRGMLKVITDFAPDEMTIHFSASVDAQLAAKQIVAGGSGGGSITYFDIRSKLTLTYGDEDQYSKPAGTRLSPTSSVFDSNVDNLNLVFLSLRPRTETFE